jgi:hypothetical protein
MIRKSVDVGSEKNFIRKLFAASIEHPKANKKQLYKVTKPLAALNLALN